MLGPWIKVIMDMVKQEMARVNVDILVSSELKWTGMDEFNSDDHYIYYCGQESLRRNSLPRQKQSWHAVLECNLKNNQMISVRFQGKPFNITVIQVYLLESSLFTWIKSIYPTTDVEEAEVEQFYDDLQDF